MSANKAVRVVALTLLVVAVVALAKVSLFVLDARRDSEIAVIGTAAVEYILDPTEPGARDGAFGEDFDVTSAGTVVLARGEALYEIVHDTAGTSALILAFKGVAPRSFALDGNDAVLTVAGGYFGMLDAAGATVDAVPLPADDMRLARSALPGVVYLFGGKNGDYRLYSFTESGAFRVLLQIEEPIVAVTDDDRAVYVATATRILHLGAGQPAFVLGATEADLGGAIVSLAASSQGDVLFFSTASRVYAMRGGAAASIVNNSGGSLRVRGDALYVLDRLRGLLYTVRPATRAIFSGG